MKAIVTGGNGFVGRYVVDELLKDSGNEVTILSKRGQPGQKTIIADVTDKDSCVKHIKGFDMVYHLAGSIRTPESDARKNYYRVNSEGTANVLEACKHNGIKKLLFVSTAEVYGNLKKSGISEKQPLNPRSFYAESKLEAEERCRKYFESHNVHTFVVRLSYTYGFGQHEHRFLPRLILDALKNRKTKMKPVGGNDFIYAKDAAKGIVLLGENINGFKIFNISSGEYTKAEKIFEIVNKTVGCEYKTTDENRGEGFSLSIEKARKVGYSPRYDIESGIKETVEKYREVLK